MGQDVGYRHSVCNVQIQEQIFEVIERQPAVSTGHLVAHAGTSHASVHHTVQEHKLYLCHIQSMQELILHDALARHVFCQWNLLAKAPSFTVKILFMDRLCPTRTGVTSIH
jgi:hypothetical protein